MKKTFLNIISNILLQCLIAVMPISVCADQAFYASCVADNNTLSPRLNLVTLDLQNSILKGLDGRSAIISEFSPEQIDDLSEIKGLIEKRLPKEYRNKFTVPNLPLHIHGEGPTLEHHLQAMLNVLSNASNLNVPEQYKRLLTSAENREFFEAFILFHDIAKISIKQKDIMEEGNLLSLYPNHESESVILLEQNSEWLSEFSASIKARLIQVIALHGALYSISAQPVSAEKFIEFLKEHKISISEIDNIMPYLIAADIIDVFGTYRPDSWHARPLNFANGYESFKKIADYQESLNENFRNKDAETAERLLLSQQDINIFLEKNKKAFLPEQESILEKSIFVSVDVGHSEAVREYAREVQEEIVAILGDESKIKLNPLKKLHFTLINNEIGKNIDTSGEGIKKSHTAYAKAIREMNSFTAEVHGPHMMPTFGIVLEVRSNSPEILLFRNEAQKALEKEMKEKGVEGFVPNIIHISLGYIHEATKDQLAKIYNKLGELRNKVRNENSAIEVHAQKIQTVKTINKAMYEQGEVVQHLSVEYLPIVMQSI